MGALGTYLATLWATVKELAPLLKAGWYAALGLALAMWRDDRKMIDQYREIVDEERKLADKPVAGAAGRLRRSKFNRSA